MIDSFRSKLRVLPFPLLLLLVVFLVQGVIWTDINRVHWKSWNVLLNFWDSGWYSGIIQAGYNGPNFAFYPLYPLVVGVLTRWFNFLQPQMVGTLFSTLLFCLTVAWLQRHSHRPEFRRVSLTPSTRWGWFLFLCSPASYVFHSHHTEALFLTLSLAAFVCKLNSKWILASILAGLCALTKNQGIFVAITIGLWSATDHKGSPIQRLGVFAASGLISSALFGLYPLYCYLKTGDALSFYSAQLHWRQEMSSHSYLKALYFGNPWQNTNTGSLLRYTLFWILLAISTALLIRRNWLGVYCLLFVGVMPMSGEFVGTFRYASVLFPIWFYCGDRLSRSLSGQHPVFTYLLAAFIIALNILTTQSYALRRWAY
jgi:Gpi18-like mannosyltransferase